MALRCGIVGLPNVGKSSLFNALTKAQAASENYPFCTIEPNIGIVDVPDPRLDKLSAIVKPERVLPVSVEFVDIAGLVEGASQGAGLGNQFLANIRETDAIVHVVRCFDDDNIIHVAGSIDPLRDIEIINTELALADLSSVDKAIHRNSKLANSGDKVAIQTLSALKKVAEPLNEGKPARLMGLTAEEKLLLAPLCLLTIKPLLYLANVAEDGFVDNPRVKALEALALKEKSDVIALCSVLEASLFDLDEASKTELLADLGLAEPGLNRLCRAAYQLLGLYNYFTAGVKEVRAWSIPIGATAPQAAGVIHTDFEKGFIRAEVIAYEDFIALGGEQGAKSAGKMRLEGKDYIVKDGDVMHFRFNV